jgi:hypothetical protein
MKRDNTSNSGQAKTDVKAPAKQNTGNSLRVEPLTFSESVNKALKTDLTREKLGK